MSKGLEERFGICGYVANGVHLRDGTKLKNLRIHKQRSDQMFDLIDPKTDTIYYKVLLTGYDKNGGILDYDLNNDSVLEQIKKDHFFVRAYSDDPKIKLKGYVHKFLYNKIILSNSEALFDMYQATCPKQDGDIDNVLVDIVHVNDTLITGTLFDAAGPIDTTGMVITVTTPDGKTFTSTNIVNDRFIIEPVELLEEGRGEIVITSDYYYTKTVPFDVLPASADSDFVTRITISRFVQEGDIYTAVIPASVHNRGENIIVEAQDDNGNIVMPEILVDNGDINVFKYDDEPIQIVIIGETTYTVPFTNSFTESSWSKNGEEYQYTISSSQHLREDISYSVYDTMGDLVQCSVELSNDDSITLSTYEPFNGNIVIA